MNLRINLTRKSNKEEKEKKGIEEKGWKYRLSLEFEAVNLKYVLKFSNSGENADNQKLSQRDNQRINL